MSDAHPRGLHLEDPGRVRVLEHPVGRGVVQRDVVDVQLDPAGAEMTERVVDHGEGAQSEEVHLEQPQRLDPDHVELRDDALRIVAGVLRELERQVVHERRVADHDAGRVHRVLAAQALERARRIDDLLRLGLLLVRLSELRRLLERVLDREVPAHHRRRIHLAEAVADDRWEAEHARRVADALLPLDGLERDDLRDVVGAVPLRRVADHLVPATLVEVHVDVGHRSPGGVQEAFEDQPVAQRIEIGDLQAVRHDRPGRRAPPRARRGSRSRARTGSGPTRSGSTPRTPSG